MTKKISFFLYNLLVKVDRIFIILFKRSFLIYFNEFFQENSYKHIIILNKKINFYVPNQTTNWRVNTFFSKEPETLEWINNFEKKKNLIFWDIGANIGLYSIYNCLKNENSLTIAFEPSSSNLRVLSRNISINNFEKKILLFPLPLTNKENIFQEMNEGSFIEGGALNSFGEKIDFEGKELKPVMKYSLLGTSINYLINNKILELPDYIKIDVDGIEHLILEGGDEVFSNKKIKSCSIEINENFDEQYNKVLNFMKKNNFKIIQKKHNTDLFSKEKKFNKTFNYIFEKN